MVFLQTGLMKKHVVGGKGLKRGVFSGVGFSSHPFISCALLRGAIIHHSRKPVSFLWSSKVRIIFLQVGLVRLRRSAGRQGGHNRTNTQAKILLFQSLAISSTISLAAPDAKYLMRGHGFQSFRILDQMLCL
jgi:hypothetical protein